MKDLNNCYKLLGVTKNSNLEEIKKAYRSKAKELHPDINGGSNEAFLAINNAYDTLLTHLNNQVKEVNTFGVDIPNWSSNNTSYEYYSYFEEMGFNNKTSFYNDSFEEDVISPPFTSNSRGEDIYVDISISYEEQINYKTINTINKRVSFNRYIKCNPCNGLGYKNYNCTYCNGKGYKSEVNYSPKYGKATTTTKCSLCGGNGFIKTSNPCSYCKGKGFIESISELDIPIDLVSVIERGQQSLCFEGLGHEVLNYKEWGMSGNLIVNLNFLKKVSDEISKVYINFIQAIEGCNIEVSLNEGKFKPLISIPPGIKSGTKLRVSKGDIQYFIEVLISVPKWESMNKKAQKLIMQLKEIL